MGFVFSKNTNAVLQYQSKIESEYEKPKAARNVDKLGFWERRLNALEMPAGEKLQIYKNTVTLELNLSFSIFSAKVRRTRPRADISTQLAIDICQPFSDDILSSLPAVTAALKTPISSLIAYDRVVLENSGLLDESLFTVNEDGDEAAFFVNRYVAFEERCEMLVGHISEENVLACITEVTGMMWRSCARFTQLGPVFSVLYNKKDLSGATNGDGRPDETNYLNDFMVCKSEHKDLSLAGALSDLTNKMTGYNIIEYGERIVFLPVVAAASTFVEIGLIDVRSKTYCSVQRFDVSIVTHRVQCFVGMINIYRLIHTMAPYIPANPTPLFKTCQSIVYHESYVTKTVSATTCPTELYDLLGRGAVTDAVTVKRRSARYNRTQLTITPLGIRTPPLGQGLTHAHVRRAVQCVLRCLQYLHKHGFVHRDLRWANIIRILVPSPEGVGDEFRYLVIDFELAGWAGEPVRIEQYIHSDVISYGDIYTAKHDMQLVAKMVRDWAHITSSTLPNSAEDFLAAVTRTDNPLEASGALLHEWLAM